MIPDPLRLVNEIIVVVVVSIALAFIWRFRQRVLVALTGDDRIHGTSLDFIWFACFRCCGACSGDWSRALTKWPCCPRRCRGSNLIKVMGQWLGVTTYTVELKNIVVGDLPWDRRGDFYLSIECAANPPMMSSLAEEVLPKVVHFPEVITLKLRWSPLEQQVRITVRELNVLGSTDLCHVYIAAMSILHWSADPRERMKRFEMKPMDPSEERETPPWILVEFDQPAEVRDLDNFHGVVNTVRTATKDGHYKDLPVVAFKHSYSLLDNTGHAIQEPLEEDFEHLQRLHRLNDQAFFICSLFVVVFIIAFAICRVYVWSCYEQMRWLTMAYMEGHTFPISRENLKDLVQWCHDEVRGTGAKPGIPCRPNSTEILDLCLDPSAGGHFPLEQPRPLAFADQVQDLIGVRHGVGCYSGTCRFHGQFVQYEGIIILGCILLVLLLCVLRFCCSESLRSMKTRQQRERAQDAQRVREEMRTKQQQQQSWGLF